MLRRAKIISKKAPDGKLVQSVEFDDGSVLAGVSKVTIEIEPHKLPKAIIELGEFEAEILPMVRQDA